jgi:membrane protein implicated in regulation of membrane protease activity
VALVIALLLALFVLPAPWNVAAVIVGAGWELATTLGAVWWSQRRAARVGAEALLGQEVVVREACDPLGRVSVRGELWRARCVTPARRGETVRVVGIDGLTLVVEPLQSSASASSARMSSGAVNIATSPSGADGHSSRGRSR